jgi:uncharacterized RDD family membrane protein YckC
MTADQVPFGMPPLATLLQRFLARLIDIVVLLALDVVVSFALLRGDMAHPSDAGSGRNLLVGVLTFVLYFAYEGGMTTARGQTLGKMALRIRSARLADGAVPAGAAGWLRAAVYALPGVLVAILIGPLFWALNSLWCVWDKPYRQCLHDKAAKTVVVAAV